MSVSQSFSRGYYRKLIKIIRERAKNDDTEGIVRLADTALQDMPDGLPCETDKPVYEDREYLDRDTVLGSRAGI